MISCTERANEAWNDYFAKSDAISERYHREAEDMRRESLIENEYYQYLWTVQEAGYGDDSDAYEASWKRTFEYAQSGAVDDLL